MLHPVRGRASFYISNLSSQVPLFPAISIFCCCNFHSLVGTFTHLLPHSLFHCNFHFPWNIHSFTATFRVSINTIICLPLSHRSSLTSRSPATKPVGAAQLFLDFVSTLSVHNTPIWLENDFVSTLWTLRVSTTIQVCQRMTLCTKTKTVLMLL